MNQITDLKFGELRKYLSIIDRFSICDKETLNYENFIWLGNVPERYDEMYVYGIGMIDSEFYRVEKNIYDVKGNREDLALLPCIEVMLSKFPKSYYLEAEEKRE